MRGPLARRAAKRGAKTATIYDVARRAGVSTYTVSVVLNRSGKVSPRLTQRVLKAAQELDYTINRIASSLQLRKTMTIGMLIPDIANPWFAKVVQGVEDICRENGYSLFLGNTYNRREDQARYLTAFRSRQVDGILLVMAADSEADLEPLVEKGKPPVVLVARRPLRLKVDHAVADNRLGARLAVEHLLSRGHRRVALLTGELSLAVTKDRVAGWKQALKAAGLPAPAEYVKAGDWTAARARTQMLELLSLAAPPTAVLTASFVILTGALGALRERGLAAPGGVEVVCSDDSEWLDVFEPRISVVLQPSYAMGAAAACLLLRRIQNPARPVERVVLKPELKLRS